MPRHFDSEHKRQTMTARIYKPAKTAMQSGTGKTKEWVLDYEPEQPREIEPLMGWTSSGDMRQQLRLEFASADEAVAYDCERAMSARSSQMEQFPFTQALVVRTSWLE